MATTGGERWAAWVGALALAVVALVQPAAAETATTPAPRSAERKDILEVPRVPVEQELGAPIAFKVTMLRVAGGWALMTGVPQRPGGRAVDYRKTRYAESMREGTFDDNVQALLRREGPGWRVVTYVIGVTDVSWSAWPEEYPAAPRALLPKIQ